MKSKWQIHHSRYTFPATVNIWLAPAFKPITNKKGSFMKKYIKPIVLKRENLASVAADSALSGDPA